MKYEMRHEMREHVEKTMRQLSLSLVDIKVTPDYFILHTHMKNDKNSLAY
jgi:hypothetical protein